MGVMGVLIIKKAHIMELKKLLRKYAGKPNQSFSGSFDSNEKDLPDEEVRECSQQSFDELPSDISDWPEYWKEAYEERAAILEYVGGLSREEAEKQSEERQRKSKLLPQ